jgi:hypothetical protein
MLSDRPRKVDMRFTSSVKIEALSKINLAYQPLSSKQIMQELDSFAGITQAKAIGVLLLLHLS